MKQLGILLLPPPPPLGWDASPTQGYPPALWLPLLIYTLGWRETMWNKVSCPRKQHDCYRTWRLFFSSQIVFSSLLRPSLVQGTGFEALLEPGKCKMNVKNYSKAKTKYHINQDTISNLSGSVKLAQPRFNEPLYNEALGLTLTKLMVHVSVCTIELWMNAGNWLNTKEA